MRSILERLRKLEAVTPQTVRVLVTMGEKKVEMNVMEFLQCEAANCQRSKQHFKIGAFASLTALPVWIKQDPGGETAQSRSFISGEPEVPLK